MKFKNLAALFLAVTLTVGICPLSAMAEEAVTETGCLDILSDTVYTFDGDEIGTYGVVSNSEVNNSTSAADDATKFAGNRAEIVPEADGSENKVLKLTQTNASYGVQVRPWYDANALGTLRIAFDIKKSGGDKGYFNIAGYKGSRDIYMLMMYGNTVYLNNTAVYTYELDTWYRFDLQLNMPQHYAKLTITKRGESEPTVIDLPYGISYTSNNMGNDRVDTTYFYIGWRAGRADGGTVMIDNYMQDDMTNNPATPSMDSHDDSFDTLPLINKNTGGNWNQTTVATRRGWTFTKADAGNYVTTEIKDGKLKLSTADSRKFPQIAKQPFYSAPNVRHRVSLKMNGYGKNGSGETARSVMIKFATKETTNANNENDLLLNFINFDSGYLKFYGMGGSADRIPLTIDPDFMYPIDFVYDAAAKVCVATVTDQYGTQHEADLKTYIQSYMDTLRNDGETDGVWYNLNSVGIRFPSGTNGNAVCYLDDFNWDILDSASVTTDASIASGSEGAASLDETVVIDYGRPVSYKKSCIGENTATVSVTTDGQRIDVPYTLSAMSGKLFVNLKGLKPQKSYTVTVSDVTLMEEDATPESVSTTFTTWGTSIGVSNIQLIDGDTNVSADIISGYADGTDVTLAAKQYTGGVLGEIKTGYVLAKRGFSETVSLHTPFSGNADSTEVFVWSDFKNMIPYCAKEVLGAPLSVAAPTVSDDSIIDSISVDDGADTLTITGTLPQDAEKWVSVEVLQPGYFWTEADAQAEADRTGSSLGTSLEEYEEGTDDIGSYLAYFGQLDNKAGQAYSIVVNNYAPSDASTLEFRMRLGDGNYFYYSARVLDLLNAATSGTEMETILEGFAFLASETQEERDLLTPDENSHFYANMLSYRNSLTGGKFSELFEVIDIADDIVRLTKLKLAENATDLNELFALCTDYGLNDFNSYDLYKGINEFKLSEGACLNATQKAALVSNLLGKKNTYATVEAFTADFNAQAVLYAASGADSKNLVLHLLKNADILEGKLGIFASCGNTKQLSVCDTINKKSVFASIEALGSEVTTLSAAPDGGQQGGDLEPEGGTGSAGSVGSGGGGNNKDKENATDKEKEDETATDKKEENEKVSFTDLDEVEWAQEAIYTLREKGIVSGRSADSFDPLATVTREEFAKMLVLAVGCYDESATADFTDVSLDAWSYSYIASAAKKGLINGIGDGKFGTGGIISRQDMALLIARAAGFSEGEKESGFADDAAISDYARSAVAFVSEQGIMNGVGNNSFAPHMQVTRAQAAKVIYELIQRG